MSFDPSHDLARGDARFALERRARRESVYSPLVILLTALAAVGIVLYSWFLLDPGNRGDLLPWSMVIVAETVLISQALVSMWTILAGAASPRDYPYHAARDALLGPPSRVVMRQPGRSASMARTCSSTSSSPSTARIRQGPPHGRGGPSRLRGEHRTWVLDDGRSDDDQRVSPPRRAPAMCGVSAATGPKPATSTTRCRSPRASSSPSSTPTSYRAGLPVRDAAVLHDSAGGVRADAADLRQPATRHRHAAPAYMQSVFYRFIQPGRNHFNAAFCVGTNVMFRRGAIDDIGGMYTDSKSEDVWTSLMLHERGWQSRLHPRGPRRRRRTGDRRGRTPSSSCAGRPAASRSCSPTTR